MDVLLAFLESETEVCTIVCLCRLADRSSCPQLDKYNLRNQEGGLARGPEVGKCRARVEELKSEVNNRLERVQASRTAR